MQIRQIHQHDFAQVDQLIRTAFEIVNMVMVMNQN
ncbi:acetyltransferase [Staphylococcus aureus]|uniref:Acetyltransferase n=1 Tax=Staphylococcus aureus TaxID=1280 RepID=A0A2X2JT29_STAAU|nr:acetyltransferase [Staphylococcus aureus]